MDNPSPPPNPFSDPEAANYSSLSEIDSVSDSDWLDISSQDTESLGLPESDRDDAYDRPLSRRSFNSHSSSRDGDVEAWEGLVEATDDEASPSDPRELSQDRLEAGRQYIRSLIVERSEEEQRVEEALNQSMVSTLSASRATSLSASGSVPASSSRPRDLRLSFPDPLSSSRDELHGSYTEVPPVVTDYPELPDDADDELEADVHDREDPGRPPTPEVPIATPSQTHVTFEIVLYGSTPDDKWRVTERLLEKLGARLGLTLSLRHAQSAWASTYRLMPKGNSHRRSLGHTISVIDSTEMSQRSQMMVYPVDRLSLAIVYHPCFIRSLPPHTLFLPVLSTPPLEDTNEGFSDQILLEGVKQQWALLDVPEDKLFLTNSGGSSLIPTEEELESLDPSEVARRFEPLLPRRRPVYRALKEQISATPTVTILAIMSLVLGYIVSRSSPLTTTLMPTNGPTTSAVLRLPTNGSDHVISPVASTVSTVQSVTSSNEVSIAVIGTPTSSLSTLAAGPLSPIGRTPIEHHVPTSNYPPAHEVQSMTAAVASSPSRGLIVPRQFPSSLSLPVPLRSKALSIFKHNAAEKTGLMTSPTPAATDSLYSLSTRLASSLSDIFNVKVLAGTLRADMKELLDALDELMRVLGTQASTALSLSKSVSETLRENLRRRNRHAQERARAMRERGEKVVEEMGAHAWGRMGAARARMEQAKARAHSVKEAMTARVGQEIDDARRVRDLLERRVKERRSWQGRKLARCMKRARGRVGI
ncbi:hypothetical protein BV25DRAFT_1106267 [Artomyces pyxidatus]|uniref:Uncharacterized protein n=1 Tax=Artomyces pyxidatus TaxID=48021 RepID=A0ACB8TGA7_9AGAM|nr:hypothetical protein BV25DRAFT_1106267 [Artomyces pyxidatus]